MSLQLQWGMSSLWRIRPVSAHAVTTRAQAVDDGQQVRQRLAAASLSRQRHIGTS